MYDTLNRIYTNFPEDYKIGEIHSIQNQKVQIIGIVKNEKSPIFGELIQYSHCIIYTPIPERGIFCFSENERINRLVNDIHKYGNAVMRDRQESDKVFIEIDRLLFEFSKLKKEIKLLEDENKRLKEEVGN